MRSLFTPALIAASLAVPFAVQAQTKLDPTALATSSAAPSGSPVSAATTPYDTSATPTPGTDNAGNYGNDYNNQNNGTGFTGFKVTPSGEGSAGSFISSSNSGIDTNGKSFGLYANGAPAGAPVATVNVSRSFASPLQYTGDSFSIQLRTNFVGAGSGDSLSYQIGGQSLNLTSQGFMLSGNGKVTGALSPSDDVLTATYTLGEGNTYNFTINGNNLSNQPDSETETGTYTQAVNQFQIIGTNPPANQFFNNLSITNEPAPTPEPGGIVPLLMGTTAMVGLIIKRRRAASATVTDTP